MLDFGEGVFLDTIEPFDLERLRCWRNSFETFKWCRQYDLISSEDQKEWFEIQRKDPTIKMYLIRDKDSVAVGVCGLTSIDLINSRAEFSLYIAPERRGNGFAKPALKTLISHGFSSLGLNHIFGETFEGNKAAKMFEDIGFRLEGTRRDFYFRGGRFIDAHIYSILRHEWFENDSYKREQQ